RPDVYSDPTEPVNFGAKEVPRDEELYSRPSLVDEAREDWTGWEAVAVEQGVELQRHAASLGQVDERVGLGGVGHGRTDELETLVVGAPHELGEVVAIECVADDLHGRYALMIGDAGHPKRPSSPNSRSIDESLTTPRRAASPTTAAPPAR